MKRIVLMMITALGGAATVAACGPMDAGALSGKGYGGDDGDGTTTDGTTTKKGDEATTPGSVPQAGPGGASSTARQSFIANVYPAMAACGSCHTAGTAGAPKFWSADASNTYQLLDSRGMIVGAGSVLVTHRHTGTGTDPSADAMGKINTWLGLEGKERVGQKAPEDIMAKIGSCIQDADWKTAETAIRTMRTRARTGEDQNTCSGCNNEYCMACHNPGYGFVTGTANDTQSTSLVKQRPFINKFFGTNGTDPVGSNALKAKSDAVATGKPYSHPNYTMPANVQTAIDTFVNKTIAAYKAGTCGTAAPAH